LLTAEKSFVGHKQHTTKMTDNAPATTTTADPEMTLVLKDNLTDDQRLAYCRYIATKLHAEFSGNLCMPVEARHMPKNTDANVGGISEENQKLYLQMAEQLRVISVQLRRATLGEVWLAEEKHSEKAEDAKLD
jgi:hypothetical protein